MNALTKDIQVRLRKLEHLSLESGTSLSVINAEVNDVNTLIDSYSSMVREYSNTLEKSLLSTREKLFQMRRKRYYQLYSVFITCMGITIAITTLAFPIFNPLYVLFILVGVASIAGYYYMHRSRLLSQIRIGTDRLITLENDIMNIQKIHTDYDMLFNKLRTEFKLNVPKLNETMEMEE